ncbi:FAD-binding protein [candidate division GN15 bacterium]|nr:FAD-binding protein [candidate division GN15 bacterium]
MPVPEAFVKVIKSEFPDDRLTFQKRVATFHPESAGEASDLFKLAVKHNQKLFITGFGNNIDPRGEPFQSMVSIRTDRLNKIEEVNEQDLFITVGAGYPLREINLRLKRHKLVLVPSMLPYVGSVGGAIAVGLSGELHEARVPMKKYLLKATVVTPTGEIITPGSICFKSVSGFDIVKVFHNSWGLLGLIVSASLRLMPETGAADFEELHQLGIDRTGLLAALDASDVSDDAVYARKIREKFDPEGVLPIV